VVVVGTGSGNLRRRINGNKKNIRSQKVNRAWAVCGVSQNPVAEGGRRRAAVQQARQAGVRVRWQWRAGAARGNRGQRRRGKGGR